MLQPRDGSAGQPVSFDGSRLPERLPLPAERVQRVDVTLAVELLHTFTQIDTPGLASLNEQTAEVTARLIEDTEDAAAHADALLYCMNGPLKDYEAAAIRRFRDGHASGRRTGATALGVLTKADQLAREPRMS